MSAPQQADGDPARTTGNPRAVITDGLPSQLPEIDPDETQEWLDSLDAVVDHAGRGRAPYGLLRVRDRSPAPQAAAPPPRTTAHPDRCPPERAPGFPRRHAPPRRR